MILFAEEGDWIMLQTTKGYFNGKEIIPLEKIIIRENQKVIITLLDEYLVEDFSDDKPHKKYVGRLSDACFKEITEALKETEKIDVDEW